MTRNYGIDLLRCVSMLMVAVLHIFGHGGVVDAAVDGSLNDSVAWFLELMCFCAVNCYALISGYVGARSNFKYSSIVILWLQAAFYSFFVTLIFFAFSPAQIGIRALASSVFPVLSGKWWYFTAYFALSFLFPVLNAGINALTEKQARNVVVSLIFVFSVIRTLTYFNIFEHFKGADRFGTDSGYSVFWLVLLYIIGGCVGKFELLKKIPTFALVIAYFTCVIITWGSKMLIPKMDITVSSYVFVDYVSPTVLICGISLLEIFGRLNIGARAARVIGFAAPATFGIYLIHEHPLIRAKFITGKFAFLAEQDPFVMLGAVIAAAVAIFVIGILIDRARILLFSALKIKKLVAKIDK